MRGGPGAARPNIASVNLRARGVAMAKTKTYLVGYFAKSVYPRVGDVHMYGRAKFVRYCGTAPSYEEIAAFEEKVGKDIGGGSWRVMVLSINEIANSVIE